MTSNALSPVRPRPSTLPGRQPASRQADRTPLQKHAGRIVPFTGQHDAPLNTPPDIRPIPEFERTALESLLPAVASVEGDRRANTNSLTNRIYRRLYDRLKGVIVYGTARSKPGDGEYEMVQRLGEAIGRQGYFTVTGGGPGAMRAAAEGARRVNAHSVGAAMDFIGEETDRSIYRELVLHPTFLHRLYGTGGMEHRGAYTIITPGGTGTSREALDRAEEVFYDKTLYPAQKQVVMVDYRHAFTKPGGFRDYIQGLVREGKASQAFANIFKYMPDENAAVDQLFRPQEPVGWTKGLLEGRNRREKHRFMALV